MNWLGPLLDWREGAIERFPCERAIRGEIAAIRRYSLRASVMAAIIVGPCQSGAASLKCLRESGCGGRNRTAGLVGMSHVICH